MYASKEIEDEKDLYKLSQIRERKHRDLEDKRGIKDENKRLEIDQEYSMTTYLAQV